MKSEFPKTSQQLALLLGVALCECFTSAQLVRTWGYREYFFVDGILGTTWKDAYLPLVEGKIGEFIKKNIAFEELETSVASAAGLFSLHGQELLKHQLPSQKNALVQLLRWGDWAVPLDVHSILEEGCYCVLQEAFFLGECEGNPIIRIVGVLTDKQKKIKKIPSLSLKDPNRLLTELELLQSSETGWSYLPKGEFAREILKKTWQEKAHEENILFVSTPCGRSLEEASQEMQCLGVPSSAQVTYLLHEEPYFDYGVLTPREGFQDLFCLEVPEQKLFDTLISSLQMMRRIPRIFSFETRVVLRAPQSSSDLSVLKKVLENESYDLEVGAVKQAEIEMRWVDAMGCTWAGPKLEIAKKISRSGRRVVLGSMFGSWERFFALLVQREQGIPFEFVKEQMRIFTACPRAKEYADEVQKQLEQAGLRSSVDQQATLLNGRIHQALKERVPYLIVVGLKEQASQRITWRTCGNETETTATVGEFLNMVKL
ncbi:MAG: hypothetical protein KGZ39_04520 [Simkania sp.]|nr:hypothetical protein [Simkania sp.]